MGRVWERERIERGGVRENVEGERLGRVRERETERARGGERECGRVKESWEAG